MREEGLSAKGKGKGPPLRTSSTPSMASVQRAELGRRESVGVCSASPWYPLRLVHFQRILYFVQRVSKLTLRRSYEGEDQNRLYLYGGLRLTPQAA